MGGIEQEPMTIAFAGEILFSDHSTRRQGTSGLL
jgi:hypothetical protein